MIKAGIVGGTGYTAGEVIRLLLTHPSTEIDFVYSTSKAGQPVASVHGDLLGDTNLTFSGELSTDMDVLFLCMGHGNTRDFLEDHPVPPEVSIIDLSRDFRSATSAVYHQRTFTYGLPEYQKQAISSAENIANPGCFATAIQLALLPLVKAGLIAAGQAAHIHGITGSTGAGSSLKETSHFSWRSNNVSVYKGLNHQHIDEVTQTLQQVHSAFDSPLHFIPVRGNFSRGIFISAYTLCEEPLKEITALYHDFYTNSPFVFTSADPLYLKQAVNTNKCLLHLEKQGDQLLITSIIDNLLKGAAGQAVQNMNLMFDLPEQSGLHLKSTHF